MQKGHDPSGARDGDRIGTRSGDESEAAPGYDEIYTGIERLLKLAYEINSPLIL